MRVVRKSQFELGQVPIDQIQFKSKSRDDVPAVLRGLQHLYCDPLTRKKIFEILKKPLRPDVSLERGRPGMDLWQIFVLAVIQKALNCDFDRLLDYADHHKQVRQMLGHADFYDEKEYHQQTVIVRREKALLPCGCESHSISVVPIGSSQSDSWR